MRRASVALSVQDARQAIRRAKLRSTSSRVAVLQHVSAAGKPVSHADVAEVLVPQGFDKSTVYRCLVQLADAGLLARLDAGDHAWRLELRDEQHARGDPPPLVCGESGTADRPPGVALKCWPRNG